MGLLNSIFKSSYSEKPEDYNEFYFRWEKDGTEYGPFFFDYIIVRKFSTPPLEGRFKNEDKWRKFKYFVDVLDNLNASQEQLDTLAKYNINFDENNLKFIDALKIIQDNEEELRKQRAIKKKENENLPATKHIISKLKKYGIKYSENITSAEAKKLISKHEEKEQFRQILDDFRKRGIDILSKFDKSFSFSDTVNNLSILEILSELNDLHEKLTYFNVNYSFPDKLNAKLISDLNTEIENALFESEDVEEQIKDREISTNEADYKIIGKLPKNNFLLFNKDILENHLRGNWDFERDIINLLKKHFPEIKIKKVDF